MSMLRAVLLDMDGVLVDSEQFILEAAIRMFAEQGVTVLPSDFDEFVGTGENSYLGGVARKHGVPFDVDRDKARTYDIYDELIAGTLEPLPGAHDFVNRCRGLNLLVAVATSADERKMVSSLTEIGFSLKDFDATMNGLQVTHRKPHPEIYLATAQRLGVDASACLVVEDSPSGLRAGREAGARCVGLTTSFGIEKLIGADWTTETLATVPDEALSW